MLWVELHIQKLFVIALVSDIDDIPMLIDDQFCQLAKPKELDKVLWAKSVAIKCGAPLGSELTSS
jgi:hypothetical protein